MSVYELGWFIKHVGSSAMSVGVGYTIRFSVSVNYVRSYKFQVQYTMSWPTGGCGQTELLHSPTDMYSMHNTPPKCTHSHNVACM